MEINLDEIVARVENIARDIGKFLIDEQNTLKQNAIEMKGTRDYVSYVDKEAEKKLVEGLTTLISNAGFLTEEETVEYSKKEYTWIIDPLDGTANYINGYTPYALSIALLHEEDVILGVVYDPVANELYSAIKNKKATMNAEEIAVSDKSEIKNSFIGFGIPYDLTPDASRVLQNSWNHFEEATFRIKGSAAIEICYVADGRYDAYFHSGLSAWDVAAGSFILQQAGGQVTDFKNGNNFIYGKELVASNSKIHTSLMKNLIENN